MFEQLTIIATTGFWVWVTFAAAAGLIVFAAMKLASYGDIIAARTKIGGMFVGVLLLAGATSLPEILTAINAIANDQPNLAAGNFFGSNAFNMFILCILDVFSRDQRVLRNAAFKHTLSGGMAVFLGTLALFFVVANPITDTIHFQIGWVGIDSILIIAFYIFGVYLIQKNSPDTVSTDMTEEELASVPSLKTGLIGFILASLLLVVVSPFMVKSSEVIADITGLGTTFIGSTLVAFVTSLPELITTITALRIGAAEMAIANLFGSNMFNMFGIAIADIFYTKGRFIATIDQSFVVVGMLGVLLTSFALIGNIVKFKRIKVIELDSIIMALMYFAGMYLLYLQTNG